MFVKRVAGGGFGMLLPEARTGTPNEDGVSRTETLLTLACAFADVFSKIYKTSTH